MSDARFIRIASIAFVGLTLFSNLLVAQDVLRHDFRNPPAAAKAGTWWHWINGNVTRHGITADLEAMKDVGLQKVQIFNVDLGDPRGPATYLGPQWLDLLEHAAVAAQRLGLELGFHNGPGWSSSGGPWVTPEFAMQTVVFSEVTHQGGRPFNAKLPEPEIRLNYYRDIAIIAFPKPTGNARIANLDFKNLSGRIRHRLMPDARAVPEAALVRASEIFDLTQQVAGDGTLQWDAPEGQWIILRIGHTPKGQRNRPAPFGGRGLECDKLNRKAVDAFWAGGIDPVLKKLDGLVGTVVTNCVIDSYEVGTTNWTTGFENEFKRLRGYDCLDYLPTLAGYYVDSPEVSERFLWDFRRTIGDLIATNYYGHFRQLCHQHGMQLSIEPYWGPFDSMQVGAQADVVMCEFWSGDVAFFDSPKFVASIAKHNGDSVVAAEAFTGQGGWVEHPATIKSIGDRAWAQGINRFIFHSYVHQPWDIGPGLTLSYHGLEFNRHNTWWKPGKAFLDYVARSQFLLQQGQSVADVLVFTGESSPNNAFAMPEIKAMGYDYDLIGPNKLHSLTVKDDLICTPTGASYRALLLPDTKWMQPRTLQQLAKLAESGATLLGPKPIKSPSLSGYPECDQQVARLADRLWDKRLIQDQTITEFLAGGATPPDFDVDVDGGDREGVTFIHRRRHETEIYFVASARKEPSQLRCRFRVSGKQPEIWNSETGEIRNAAVWKGNGDGTTSVPVSLDAEGSAFVIFRKPTDPTDHLVEAQPELVRPPLVSLSDLKIIQAEYGTFLPDGLLDVTETVARQVKNNQLNTVASRGLFGYDPAPGYKKELRIKYQIGDKARERSCVEQESVTINGSDAGELKIKQAIFGKFSKESQGLPAEFSSRDVTSTIEARVAAGQLRIPVNEGLIDEPSAQGTGKRLRIVYSTNGVQQVRTIPARGTLNLARDVPESRLVAGEDGIHWLTPAPGMLNCKTAADDAPTFRVQSVPQPIELVGPWEVRFPIEPESPLRTTFDQLNSWSFSSNDAIRYFSGTATYQTQLNIPAELIRANLSLELDLGSVHEIAEVSVNGKSLGTLWKAPFRIGLDGAITAGRNELQIKVTNLWPNRLIGDEQLPGDAPFKKKSVKQWPEWLLKQAKRDSGRVSFAAYRHWSKNSPLQKSGLLGPITIRPYVRVKVK